MSSNKAQLTIFALIAVVLIITAGLVIWWRGTAATAVSSSTLGTASQLASETVTLRAYIESCLEKTTHEGIYQYGILGRDTETALADYISGRLPECANLGSFTERGASLKRQSPSVNVTITEKAVVARLNYPLTLSKAKAQNTISQFIYVLERDARQDLALGPDGRTATATTLSTDDGRAELRVPAGTLTSDSEDHPVTSISFHIQDTHDTGLENRIVVGTTIYDGMPEGTQFDPPVTLTIRYRPQDIPAGVDPASLSIAWFDASAGIWKAVPSEVLQPENIVRGTISHFSPYAVTYGCNALSIKPMQLAKRVFIQSCGAYDVCMQADWETANAYGFHEEQRPATTPVINALVKKPIPRMTPNEKCGPPLDWDTDDIDANDCPECHDDCLGKIGTVDPKFRSGDGIKDGSCSCAAPPQDSSVCDSATPATPMTYGYTIGKEGAGGWGELPFTIADKGNGCVSNSQADAKASSMKIAVDCGSDTCGSCSGGSCGVTATVDGVQVTQKTVLLNPVTAPTQSPLGPSAATLQEQGIHAGKNTLAFYVDNTNPDGCAKNDVSVEIQGIGIYGDAIVCSPQDMALGSDDIDRMTSSAAQKVKMDSKLVKSLVHVESFNGGQSRQCWTDGTVYGNEYFGLMQIGCSERPELCPCIFGAECNIEAGTQILKAYYDYCADESHRTLTCEDGNSNTFSQPDCAVRRYNSWKCCPNDPVNSPDETDCLGYVAKAKAKYTELSVTG